jgi:hypothetical protein
MSATADYNTATDGVLPDAIGLSLCMELSDSNLAQ